MTRTDSFHPRQESHGTSLWAPDIPSCPSVAHQAVLGARLELQGNLMNRLLVLQQLDLYTL